MTFEPKIVASVFDHFYENYCGDLSSKEKKLLLNLKSVQSEEIDSGHVNKFQEVLLVNALNENNKIKQFKIAEAISYTDEAVIITDLSGLVLEANKTFEKYFGQRYMKSSVKNLLPKDFIEEAFSTVNLNSSCKSELNLKTIYGKNQLLNVSCYSYRDELNRPNGFVFIFKDVTDLKKLDYINKQLISKLRERNVQLTDVNKRLTDAEKIRIDLLSVISHELKTPISTIIGFGELISQREYDSETIKNFANHIVGSANSLNKLICDYLEVATNTFGVSKDKLQTSPVNVKALIDECYKEESKNIKDSKIEFEISSIGYEPIIFSEVENVKKLFSNLLNNSIKFSPNAGKVSVKVLSDGEKVTVSISDEGIGLTLEQAKQVFEPFYRADNSITRQFAGIGLGLSVCRKIVELYGGSIWCEPGVDKGTVFYVTLPVNPHKPQEIKENSNQLNSNQNFNIDLESMIKD